MTEHTPKTIARRIRAAVTAARKLFATESELSLDQRLLKALRRLERVEDDCRFLTEYGQDGSRDTTKVELAERAVFEARRAIREAKEQAQKEAREYRELQIAALDSVERDRRRETFASRCNLNLTGGR